MHDDIVAGSIIGYTMGVPFGYEVFEEWFQVTFEYAYAVDIYCGKLWLETRVV